MEECFFCGARCMAIQNCTDNRTLHKTNFHRPMAFKGSFEMVGEKKNLLQDFCLSDFNLNESRWPKPDEDLSNM